MCSIFKIPVCPLILMFGTVNSVAIVLSSPGASFPMRLSISALLSLIELRFLAECACISGFVFPEIEPHVHSVLQAS